ncbi:metalloregulator ArsR/SmtB family transcription factor [Candidatus Pacearchaeota archaeon]|nr:metalloregulator ArsR/SmtB family transcription factor [Candidatus Pacearchaeota archaeon]MBD3283484.1 metalloregulator ArsR/SmtB family transcription factor [Candidatus Pacearchaeota archaeon]
MFCKTLANRTRYEIIRILADKPRNVKEICKKTGFEQSRVSHNLKKLEKCGFVSSVHKGKNRIYSLDREYILPILKNIDKYIEKYQKRLKVCHLKLKM